VQRMPTGRLRTGFARVAGVASVGAVEELRKLMGERGLPSFSQAVGVALEEWLAEVRRRVVDPGPGDGVPGPCNDRSRAIDPIVGGCKPPRRGGGADLRLDVQVSPSNSFGEVPEVPLGHRLRGEGL
jgi:hypothetical protein